jgi:protein SCO1/2
MDRRDALGGLGALAAAVAAGPAGAAAPGSRWARYFPNFILRTQDDEPVRFYDDLVKEKIAVINFMYVHCADGQCAPATANLVTVQRMLGGRVGRDIFMYSVTLDPRNDTPPVLKKYAEVFAVKPGWLFLTGEETDIEVLRRKLGFYDLDPGVDRDPSTHTGMLRFGNDRMNWWASCPILLRPELVAKKILRVDWPPGMNRGAAST